MFAFQISILDASQPSLIPSYISDLSLISQVTYSINYLYMKQLDSDCLQLWPPRALRPVESVYGTCVFFFVLWWVKHNPVLFSSLNIWMIRNGPLEAHLTGSQQGFWLF